MTTLAANDPAQPTASKLAPDALDRLLAGAAAVLFVAVLLALWRGQAEWALVPMFVWAHIATIITAVTLTPLMLLRRRGDQLHRTLGWVWVAAMFLTALISFWVRGINGTALSLIHILSAWTLIQVPVIVWSARTHRVDRHRRAVRGMVTGALLIAGVFTFPFGRLMGHWLFG
ncbi:MAG: hypothetical protein JNM81_15490 [Rhodospirillaceae bacterium]|nr:hypothetical protein [Rhodospirillaceae bacterium]